MSTARTWQTTSTSLDDTLAIAAGIGRRLRGGEMIELVSDLGGGKTAFVRGLAAGMGSHDTVRSPSFTLQHQYRADKHKLYHFDFYRLFEPGIMREELAEALAEPGAVVAIEWPNIIEGILPTRRLTVHIKTVGPNRRQLSFSYPRSLDYLLPRDT